MQSTKLLLAGKIDNYVWLKNFGRIKPPFCRINTPSYKIVLLPVKAAAIFEKYSHQL